MFFGSPRGGEAASVLFTLTATCRRLQIDPYAYLRDIFERLPKYDVDNPESLKELLPDAWLAAHPKSKLEFRADESEDKAARKRAERTRRRKALKRKRG